MLTCLIMAEQAAGVIGTGADELLDGGAGPWSCFAGRLMTLGAGVFVQPEDAGPVVAELAVAGIAVLAHGLIDAVSLDKCMDMSVAGK